MSILWSVVDKAREVKNAVLSWCTKGVQGRIRLCWMLLQKTCNQADKSIIPLGVMFEKGYVTFIVREQ